MQERVPNDSAVQSSTSTGRQTPSPGRADPATRGRDADEQFMSMLKAYRSTGGLVRTAEMLALLQSAGRTELASITTMGRWIAARQVICFDWQSQSWLPFFQFDRVELTPLPVLAEVYAELSGICDAWALAVWFARPKASLANRPPVDALAYNFPAVLQAARTDRLAAGG